jgi:hypothetical protein
MDPSRRWRPAEGRRRPLGVGVGVDETRIGITISSLDRRGPRSNRIIECGNRNQLRYLKESAQPYTFVFAEEHRFVRDNVDIEPLTAAEYFTAVEEAAGR